MTETDGVAHDRRFRIGGTTLEVREGDLGDQPDMDAVVNAANAALRSGGGVAGALHRAAGPGLAQECAPLAPIRPGEAVITGAHGLSNRYVIHCLGPVYGRDEPAAELLAACYRNALRLAAAHGIVSLAFPAISAGAFGYPAQAAARIALQTVLDELRAGTALAVVRFVLHGEAGARLYAHTLEQLTAPP